MSGPAPASRPRAAGIAGVPTAIRTPRNAPLCTFEQLAYLELLVLSSKLRTGKRRALRAAMRSRSMAEIWAMIRISNDLTDLGEDVGRTLARY